MNIANDSLFVNSEGRTIKVKKIDGQSPKDKVEFHVDGSKSKTIHTFEVFNKMLESAGYKDITQTFSGFSFFKDDDIKKEAIGYKVYATGSKYTAEVIKKDSKGIHVKFSEIKNYNNSTIYIYDENGFDLNFIFTPDLLSELESKFTDSNVFEVIGEDEKSNDLKFTIIGKTINSELLDKILKAYGSIRIYQIKRLTNINIQ